MNSSYLIKSISECVSAFTEDDENSPNWQSACRDLGNLLQGMGRFDEAITWHSLALENEPNLAEIYAQIGRLYAQEENWEEAIAFFEDALKRKPNAVYLYSNLAQIYGQLGRRESEIACWYKAVELNPDLVNAQGYYKLAKAFEQEGKASQALECYERACDRGEALIPAHYELAEIRLRQGDLESAKTCYQRVLAQDSNQPQAHYKLGLIFARQQQFEPAVEALRQTIKLAPDFPWAYRDLVQTFLQFQKWDEAIATCHAIINLVEEFPWIYGQLGNALLQKGRIPEAAIYFQKACVARGWEECAAKNYFFPNDRFSFRIPILEHHLKPLAGQEGLNILEVGNHQGMSACWLLDKILTHPTAKITCLDHQFDKKLKENLDKNGAKDKITLIEGAVRQNIASFPPHSFDVANLQDKRKDWNYVRDNTAQIWKSIKVGGIVIFNDYGWRNPKVEDEKQNPKKGVDLFLNSIKGQWEVLAHPPYGFQFIIRKTGS